MFIADDTGNQCLLQMTQETNVYGKSHRKPMSITDDIGNQCLLQMTQEESRVVVFYKYNDIGNKESVFSQSIILLKSQKAMLISLLSVICNVAKVKVH